MPPDDASLPTSGLPGGSGLAGRPSALLTIRALLIAAVLTTGGPAGALGAQETCPQASGADAEAGWEAYRDGRLAEAERLFDLAVARCPEDSYARTGMAYALLRAGAHADSRSLFESVLTADPGSVDAMVGLGLLAWREGELDRVEQIFDRVLELAPGHPTALDYLSRLPPSLGPPPDRPELVLPDTLTYPARTAGERFEVRGPGGWEPFYIKGVNLGAALPGRHPSEFPDSATYAKWIAAIAAMSANAVRVYTIHPPHFYGALQDWNVRHPEQPLWLIHGVWTELPEDHDFAGARFEDGFFGEMRRVVDVLHGRADIAPEPGHAWGHYVADVSPWTLAFIIGREWEPFSTRAFGAMHAGESGFRGRYLTVEGGGPMDAWLGRAMEEITAYETETYRSQRPVAYTNWPTLDPLSHPTEASVDEEMALRRERGEQPTIRPGEYDNDTESVDPNFVWATEAFPAGTFASYHAYPYYPDFMLVQEEYAEATSSLGRSNYFGYLQDLKRHHTGMPVVIAEYGVPASITAAHLQPQGWHHGGLTEREMAEVDRRMTLELAESGMAGGILFAWVDEWFKKNWVVIDFELPADRNRLWLNRLDAEQHYGMWAMEAEPPLAGATMDARLESWGAIEPLYQGEEGSLRVAHDAAYLWLMAETPLREARDVLHVGFDLIRPDAGDFRWPGAVGPRLPVGLEFALQDDGSSLRLVVDPPSSPFRLEAVGERASGRQGMIYDIENPPDGMFRGRQEARFNLPFYTEPNEDGAYDSLRIVVNRRRFSRGSDEFLAVGFDRGVLPGGNLPDGLWERSPDRRFLEVRIPWMLLNFTDPSSRSLLQGPGENTAGAERAPDGRWRLSEGSEAWPDSLFGVLGTETVEDIGVVMALQEADGGWRHWPAGDSSSTSVARFSWETWEQPDWEERPRPVYEVMRETFSSLVPPVLAARSGVVARAPDPPDQSVEADEAWRSGDHPRSLELYRTILRTDPDNARALHRVAIMTSWAEEYGEALTLLDRLIGLDPDNLDARVDRARITAWSGDIEDALGELGELLDEHPDHPPALEATARFLAWSGQYDASLSSYERLLAIAPDNADARRGQATALSSASRFDAARVVYDSLLVENPGDLDARLGLARVLAFSDDLDGSEAEYRTILADRPGEIGALQGLGRTLSWAGRLADGEDAYRYALAEDPEDVTTLLALGQNLRWQGRDAAALELIQAANELSPSSVDARLRLTELETDLAPQGRPSLIIEDDSDGNHMVTTRVRALWHPVPRLELAADVYQRDLEHNALTRTAVGLEVTGSFFVDPGWTVRAGLGGSENDGTAKNSFTAWRVGLSSPSRNPVQGTVTVASSALDATAALVERGVQLDQVTASGRWIPASGWRLDGSLGLATFQGSVENGRTNVAFSATKRLGRVWTVGGGFRTFGFDDDLNEGYFDPDFYGIVELTGRWLHTPDRWTFLVEFAPGLQQVTSEGDPAGAFRASTRAGYQFARGKEVSVGAGYSSAGLQSFSTGASDYRYTAVILSASWVF
jgi:tetratricopeptide (TPR) repeat protein